MQTIARSHDFGALIVKHVEGLSDEKTIQAIQENPYMQYKDCHVDCYNHPLGRPPKDENDRHAEDKKRAIGEWNEVEATFGTSKRVYRANDIRAKLDDKADTWIGACFFAKNVMKFLRELLCLIFAKLGLKAFKRRFSLSQMSSAKLA